MEMAIIVVCAAGVLVFLTGCGRNTGSKNTGAVQKSAIGQRDGVRKKTGEASDSTGRDYLKIGFDLMKNEAVGFLKIGTCVDMIMVTGPCGFGTKRGIKIGSP